MQIIIELYALKWDTSTVDTRDVYEKKQTHPRRWTFFRVAGNKNLA